ncbi:MULTISPECIES: YceI family protein [Burkholderia]|uniref:YceI family protein n=1 Tax=Burkholderia TaxID=32008 RepID=UPI002AB63B80|nr:MULTISPECIES: YceI family protein [Burkholderia]
MLNFLLPLLRNAAVVEPGSVACPAWSFEVAHTHISFSGRHLGFARTPGIFRRFDAQLAFDDEHIEASRAYFEIDAASIDTAIDLRDEHLRGTDWLHVHAHPKIAFVSHSVRLLDGRQYAIDGDLTIRGITLPALFDATLIDRAVNPWTRHPVVGFEATASVSRSAYGMDAILHALSDDVRLKIATEIRREP